MRASPHRCSCIAHKKPTVARCSLAALLSLVVLQGVSAQARTRWTERDVVMRALSRAPFGEALAGEMAIAEGRGRAMGAYPNPQLSYVREQTFGALGTGEDYLTLAQLIDLGNRRGLLREAGSVRTRAAQREGEMARAALTSDARLRFYAVLHRQRRVEALTDWTARITDALAIVARREQRGDAAVYDRRRLERERAVATGRLEIERAALERAAGRLLALLGTDAQQLVVEVAGTLLPEAEPAPLTLLTRASEARPDLQALSLRDEAAALERRAASRSFIPDLRLEGGWKGVELRRQGRADGFLLGASLVIPLWDQAQGQKRIAEGESLAARGRRGLIAAEISGELAGARAEAVRLLHAAGRFRQETSAASADLERIAGAGYAGGELGLLELLDAYRGGAEDALTTLDMELAARTARIELDRLTGAALP